MEAMAVLIRVNGYSKWTLDWEVPFAIVREMHVAQLLFNLSSLTVEHTNSSVVG
jgi:hypothetical protein